MFGTNSIWRSSSWFSRVLPITSTITLFAADRCAARFPRYLQDMMLTPRGFAGFALAVSAAVLGTALLSHYWGGLVPCELCLVQRWPWEAAIVIALVALAAGSRPALPWVALLLALVYASSATAAFYHVGVEQHWFRGPTACT